MNLSIYPTKEEFSCGTGLLLVDIQDSILKKINNSDQLTLNICKLALTAKAFGVPILITEQKKLGPVSKAIRSLVNYPPLSKTFFSCDREESISSYLELPQQWIIAGVETHVCILQTVKHVIDRVDSIIICKDTMGSRNTIDHETAIEEMHSLGASVSTAEALIFEMIQDSSQPIFKELLPVIKAESIKELLK